MGSKTNRNLQAKFEKAKRQIVEVSLREFSKPAYTTKPSVPDYDPAMVRRVGMNATARKQFATVNSVETVAWVRSSKALTMRQTLRQHI